MQMPLSCILRSLSCLSDYRYLYELATDIQPTLAELSLLEWESTFASSKNLSTFLQSTETKLSHAKVPEPTSPASIALFASLYALSENLHGYPATEEFFKKFLAMETTKTGIETATAYTAEEKIGGSNVVGRTAAASPSPKIQKLRHGIFANKLDGTKMSSFPRHP